MAQDTRRDFRDQPTRADAPIGPASRSARQAADARGASGRPSNSATAEIPSGRRGGAAPGAPSDAATAKFSTVELTTADIPPEDLIAAVPPAVPPASRPIAREPSEDDHLTERGPPPAPPRDSADARALDPATAALAFEEAQTEPIPTGELDEFLPRVPSLPPSDMTPGVARAPETPRSGRGLFAIAAQAAAAARGEARSPKIARAATYQADDLSGEWALKGCRTTRYDGRDQPTVGRYIALRKLGEGGMGAVYSAVHEHLDTRVALKLLLRPNEGLDDETVQRFFREARIAAALRSERLVRVFDVALDETSGGFFIVMEYVEGVTASSWSRGASEAGALPRERHALEVIMAAAEGLAVAHLAGIVHRDVKPGNILIPQDTLGRLQFRQAKLSDLGLARAVHGSETLTGGAVALGSPGYMAPEQTQDAKRVLPAADVFGMGATLYALLAGHAPFKGESPYHVLAATVRGRMEPLEHTRSDITSATAELIRRCLSPDPRKRPDTAAELLTELERCRDAAPGAGTRTSEIQVEVSKLRASATPRPGDAPGKAAPNDGTDGTDGGGATAARDGVATRKQPRPTGHLFDDEPRPYRHAFESRPSERRPTRRERALARLLLLSMLGALVFVGFSSGRFTASLDAARGWAATTSQELAEDPLAVLPERMRPTPEPAPEVTPEQTGPPLPPPVVPPPPPESAGAPTAPVWVMSAEAAFHTAGGEHEASSATMYSPVPLEPSDWVHAEAGAVFLRTSSGARIEMAPGALLRHEASDDAGPGAGAGGSEILLRRGSARLTDGSTALVLHPDARLLAGPATVRSSSPGTQGAGVRVAVAVDAGDGLTGDGLTLGCERGELRVVIGDAVVVLPPGAVVELRGRADSGIPLRLGAAEGSAATGRLLRAPGAPAVLLVPGEIHELGPGAAASATPHADERRAGDTPR